MKVKDEVFDDACEESLLPTGSRKLMYGTHFAVPHNRPNHLLAEEQVCQVAEVPKLDERCVFTLSATGEAAGINPIPVGALANSKQVFGLSF